MSWFRSRPPARIEAYGSDALVIAASTGDRRVVKIPELSSIAFVNIGESFFANENGWWLLHGETTTLGIWNDCPVIETAMRGPLAQAVDALGNLAILHLATTPKFLWSAQRTGGVVDLGAVELAALRDRAGVEPIDGVSAVPHLP